MSTISTAITTIASTDTVSASRSTINTNFALRGSKNIRTLADADSPYNAVEGDDVILAASTAAIIQVFLPPAADVPNRVISVVTTFATGGGVEVFADGSETINGSNNVNLYSQYEAITIVSNGTEWFILSMMP